MSEAVATHFLKIIHYGRPKLAVPSLTSGSFNIRDPNSAAIKTSADQASLEEVLTTMAVADSTPSPGQKLQLKSQGRIAPQEQIFDIKTRAQQNIFDMEEILPRLWVNQTSKFLFAYHRYGMFDNPGVDDVRQLVVNCRRIILAFWGGFAQSLSALWM